MRIRIWHIVFFALVLVGAAIVGAPASYFANQHPDAFRYERARGTVWNARFENAELGPFAVGAVDWRLSFWDLVWSRKFIADMELGSGAIEGDVQFLANLEGDRRIVAQSVVVEGLPLGSVMLAGTTTIQGLDVYFDDGACSAASGTLQSDALTRNFAALRWRGPPLAGAAACDGADAVIAIDGRQGEELVRARLRLRGDGRGEWRVEVEGARPETAVALAAAGFGPQAGGATATGELQWTPF